MALTLITADACRQYDLPAPYPDRARRLTAIEDQLIAAGLDGLLLRREADEAEESALTGIHDGGYLADIADREPAAGWAVLDGDTLLVPGILKAARHAAGAALAGVDTALEGGKAFALTRPPGHHAHRSAAGGFCLINHAALAAVRARNLGAGRVAVIDFDAHHGDGTEALVADDPGIRLFSLYEADGFRAPAPGAGPGGSLRLALPHGGDGADLRRAAEDRLFPALAAFRPDLLVVSAGFDGHREDDLSDLALVEGDFAWLAAALEGEGGNAAERGTVFLLEGGYAPAALGRSVASVISALL